MPTYKDEKTGTWYCKFYYTDWQGNKKQKLKRGFKLQREAKDWERDFLMKQSAQPSMPFRILVQLYLEDKKEHAKASSYETKESRIRNWITPFFSDKPVDAITAADVRKWQSELKNATNSRSGKLSPGYMQILVTELSSIFGFAVRFYGLSSNPCTLAGNTVGKRQRSINFWTKEEFDQFINTFDGTDPYKVAFFTLYYTGMRIGELLALTLSDIDFKENTISITKTFQVVNRQPTVTTPKTEKSNRSVFIPQFLADMLRAYCGRIYGAQPDTRLFMGTQRNYRRVLNSHAEKAGVKQIRVHDLRHPYVKPTTKKFITFFEAFRAAI